MYSDWAEVCVKLKNKLVNKYIKSLLFKGRNKAWVDMAGQI